MTDLDALMRLKEAATPGPWYVGIGDFESEDGYGTVTAPYVEADGKTICVPFDRDPEDENDESDAAYIVAACNAVPELVHRIRELEAQRDRLQDAAEFEARVAAKQATAICGQCDKFNSSEKGCPLAIFTRPGLDACRLKHARLAVEAEMLAEGKGPGRKE